MRRYTMKRYSLAACAVVLSFGAHVQVPEISPGFKNIPKPTPEQPRLTLGPPVEEMRNSTNSSKRNNKFPFQRKLKRDARHRS